MAISTPNISFGGLASGLDTRAIIDALVQVERIPMLRLEQRKRALQSQDSLFANLSTKLEALDKIAESLEGPESANGFGPIMQVIVRDCKNRMCEDGTFLLRLPCEYMLVSVWCWARASHPSAFPPRVEA